MADINVSDVKMLKSVKMDDTDFGGGQMTDEVLTDGAINEAFADISRTDRTYGRVAMRKLFMAVKTENRETYYGSNIVLSEQAEDSHVGIIFFSSEDWFDKRADAQSRIESYMVKGPFFPAKLWANHYTGSRQVNMFSELDQAPPEIGDVIVLTTTKNLFGETVTERVQYLKVTDVTSEVRSFIDQQARSFQKLALYLEVGSALEYDFPGEEAEISSNYANASTVINETVVADASKYYGVTTLAEDITTGDLQLRVEDIFSPIVPSASSETSAVDHGIGFSRTAPMAPDGTETVTRPLTYVYAANASVFLGEPIIPGTYSDNYGWFDDGQGNFMLSGYDDPCGSIDYISGTITFGAIEIGTWDTYGVSATYQPGISASRVMYSAGIEVSEATRGYTYTFRCDPIPKPGTVRIDYLAGGKWYTMQDGGTGRVSGVDTSIGTATVSFETGSISISLGSYPDIGSLIIIYWGVNTNDLDISSAIEYTPVFTLTTNHEGVLPGTFKCSWGAGVYDIRDSGSSGILDYYVNDSLATSGVGDIVYSTGEIIVDELPITPAPATSCEVTYNYGDPGDVKEEEFINPTRSGDSNNTVVLGLANVGAMIPGSVKIKWPTIYSGRTDWWRHYYDDCAGAFKYEQDTNDTPGYNLASIVYTAGAGEITFSPDQIQGFYSSTYGWRAGSSSRATISGATAQGGDAYAGLISNNMWLPYVPTLQDFLMVLPITGTITVNYQEANANNSADYTDSMDYTYNVSQNIEGLNITNGSLRLEIGSLTYVDRSGKLFELPGADGVYGAQVGEFNYTENRVRLTDSSLALLGAQRPLTIIQGVGTVGHQPTSEYMFRTPGSPVRVESMTLVATDMEGNTITAASDTAGRILGTNVRGQINYTTGVCFVMFGQWVVDDASAQAEEWYDVEMVDNGYVWQPLSVDSSTMLINCTVVSYLPLDPDLLGLDPVRLPTDGRVPIFRDADMILIHNTEEQTLATDLIDDQVVQSTRDNVEILRVVDVTGAYVPEIDEGSPVYSVDYADGSITVLDASYLNTHINLPLRLLNRIEDQILATDVQVTGHIATTTQILHDYPVSGTLVSSILPSQDLQSRIENEFVQAVWTGDWSDVLVGEPPLTQYDLVNYPLTVNNTDAIEERFCCIFNGATNVQVIGEHLGIIFDGPIGSDIAPINPATGNPYFTIDYRGWGVGWSIGDVFRFNSKAANFPLWIIRTTLQGPPEEAVDNYIIEVRGDSS